MAPLDLKTVYTAVRCVEGNNQRTKVPLRSARREPSRAYAIDFGVVNYVDDATGAKSQDTVLVKMNDGYSLGLSPGCPTKVYTNVLLERWHELVGLEVSPSKSDYRNSCHGQYDNDGGKYNRWCQGEYR